MGKSSRKIDPTAEQKEYIDRINDPRTAQDLVLALSNPATPAYKEMMNLLIAGIDMDIIIHRLIERYIHREFVAYDNESKEIYYNYLQSVIAFEERMRQQIPHVARTFEPVSMDKWDLAKLQSEWTKSVEEGEKLRQQSHQLHEKLAEINQRKDKNTADWQTNNERNIEKSVAALEASGDKLHVWDAKKGRVVELNTKETKALLEKTAPVAPAKLIDVLSKSYYLQPDVDTAKSIIPLAPLAPPMPDKLIKDLTANLMAKKSHVTQQIDIMGDGIKDLPGGVPLANLIFEILNKSKKANQQITKIVFEPKNIENETHLMQDAINNYQEECAVKWASRHTDQKLAQNVKRTKEMAHRFEEMTGSSIKDRKVHFAEGHTPKANK